jgi:hypothetical protein
VSDQAAGNLVAPDAQASDGNKILLKIIEPLMYHWIFTLIWNGTDYGPQISFDVQWSLQKGPLLPVTARHCHQYQGRTKLLHDPLLSWRNLTKEIWLSKFHGYLALQLILDKPQDECRVNSPYQKVVRFIFHKNREISILTLKINTARLTLIQATESSKPVKTKQIKYTNIYICFSFKK